jgi:peptide/nickel transport system substrate-binding protein
MNKTISAILGLAILTALMVQGTLMVFAVTPPNPPGDRPMQLYGATIQGGNPRTVDPARAYDTASGAMIMNVYDTLLMFDSEHLDTYLKSLADSWHMNNITGTTSPEGLPWYYQYVFTMRDWANMTFAPKIPDGPYNYTVTAADVEYSIERAMVMDKSGGPQWMFYEPLTESWGSGYLGNMSDEAAVSRVGKIIDHAVNSDPNGTVWFNLAFPGSYAPFLQIMTQTWASILSKQWIINYVNGVRGRNDWDGDWSLARTNYNWTLDHTEWRNHRRPAVGLEPLDVGGAEGGLMHGTGPFILTTLDTTNKFWSMARNVKYWRGWPADFPFMANARPRGYVNEIKQTWAFDWTVRKTMFLAGDVDFCAVPRESISEIHQSIIPPFKPPNYPQDGLRLIYPLPALSIDVGFFCFDIDPLTTFGNVFADSHFAEDGVPHDFFGNATWGAHVRKAFAFAFDYSTYLQQAYLGEASGPESTPPVATALIPGLPYYDPTVKGYNFSLTKALAEFTAVPGLIAAGFDVQIVYNSDSPARYQAAVLLKAGIDALEIDTFHVTIASTSWASFLEAFETQQLTYFILGWLADYPDMHNFAAPFYRSTGDFGGLQLYSNPAMDALIDSGIRTPDGPDRAAIYKAIAQLAVTDCPSMALAQAIGRHYEADWVTGWYYNSVYPGNYFYNLWKWYYAPQVKFDPVVQPFSFRLPADVNYDGKVNVMDVSTAAKSFGASAGPPLDTRWCFRVDVNNDRKIDINDISYVAKYFGATEYEIWAPPV